MEEEPQSGEREGETWAEDDGAGSSLGARQANPGYGTAAGANAPPCELAELSGVQIPVRTATGGGKPGEWTMVELQGTVETGSAPLAGIAIGDLTILSGDKATLRIGRQILDGSMVSLKSPQAVLTKGPSADGAGTCYTMVGVIRRKATFTTRPNPVKQPAAGAEGGSSHALRENSAPSAAEVAGKRARDEGSDPGPQQGVDEAGV